MNKLDDFIIKIDLIEKKINYNFQNKKLLIQAFTHPSFKQKENYEKLEFLGDSLINFFTTNWLFLNKKNIGVGNLSIEKSQIVNNKLLSSLIIYLKLDQYILVGKNVDINTKITSDVFESISGAIYLDSNFEVLFDFLNKYLIKNLNNFKPEIDYKGKFITYIQNKTLKEHEFKTDYNKKKLKFITTINLKGKSIYGCGENKKSAEQDASKKALKHIEEKLI